MKDTMSTHSPLLALSFFSLALAIIPISSQAEAQSEIKHILDHLVQTLPEKENAQAITQLMQANNKAANSWIAGDVDLTVRHENDTMTGNQGYQSWELGAAFPVWLPGQSDAKQQLSDNYRALKQAQYTRLELLASNKLRTLIWQLKKSKATLNYREKNHQQALILENLIQQRVDAGESPKMDLLMAQQSTLNAMKQLTLARQNVQMAQDAFSSWTGKQNAPKAFSETLQNLDVNDHPTVTYLKALQSIENEKLQLTRYSQKQNPYLYLGTKTDKSHQTSNNTMLVAQITFPMGINKQSAIAISEQNQSKISADIALKQFIRQLGIDRKRTAIHLSQTQQTEQLAKTQLTLSIESVKLAKQAYQRGETSIQVLLQATQQLYDNELNYRISQLNTQASISAYNQTQGIILK